MFFSILNSNSLLDIKDNIFDDYGNGKVTYPDNPIFKKGIFDITEFKIEENPNSYKFTIVVRTKINKVKNMIFENKFETEEFNREFDTLQKMLENDSIELGFIKLELLKRQKKHAQNQQN